MYSQFGQDVWVFENIFQQRSNGFFLDIGATDGIKHSNTKLFEENGWSGICLEPRIIDFHKLCSNRKCVCCNVAAYSTSMNEIEFTEYIGYGCNLSGITSRLSNVRPSLNQRSILTQTISINDLCDQHGVLEIDFISIDVEGSEMEVLKGLDFDKINVTCLTIENNENQIEPYMNNQGFSVIKTLGVDKIYVKD